ncbi:MAG: hypothetical protein HY363_05205 [Candidatus Aenigmarchaeota archaeon]|nr:hypothetical protein [Candidatus Aenigmarchaeota archaeon]
MKRSVGNLAEIIFSFGVAAGTVSFGAYATYDYATKIRGPEKQVLNATEEYVGELSEKASQDNEHTKQLISYARHTLELVATNPQLTRDARLYEKELMQLEEQLKATTTPELRKAALETASARLDRLSDDKFSGYGYRVIYGLSMLLLSFCAVSFVGVGIRAYREQQ